MTTPSPTNLWREITTTETPDLEKFFASVWKNGLWAFFEPEFSSVWDNNLPRFKEQIAQETDDGVPLTGVQWECIFILKVSFWIPTDDDDVAHVVFHKTERVALSLEPRQWKNTLVDDVDQYVQINDPKYVPILEVLNTRAMSVMGSRMTLDNFAEKMRNDRYPLLIVSVDESKPLDKLISDVSNHAICYERVEIKLDFILQFRYNDSDDGDVRQHLLPQEYRKLWFAKWRTTAQRHALHLRIQPLQDMLAKAATYTEDQMQSAVAAGRPMPELGRLCREMRDIADEIPGLVQNDSLFPISENYPLIRRRLLDVQNAYEQVARICERPDRWNVTTLPLIAQQFGQQAKGLSRTQSQRAELERARAQTQREETDRASR